MSLQFLSLGNDQKLSFLLNQECAEFLTLLHETFEEERTQLLLYRKLRNNTLSSFPLKDSKDIQESEWKAASVPKDLNIRRVEITGPVEKKMMINALNSGADTFMADLEDATSPTWENISNGHQNLYDAVRKNLFYFDSKNNKNYSLNDMTATLLVRPRGWHLNESNVIVNKQPISASLFDFGVFFFHNAALLIEHGSAPYFYLAKLEYPEEAALWAKVFRFSEQYLNICEKTIRATILIETITAGMLMESMLYHSKDYVCALNAGRWDYIFSLIKRFGSQDEFILPNRQKIAMTVPFMKAYTDKLLKTCQRRHAQPIGGMSAFIPSRKDEKINERAFSEVLKDKTREAYDGFCGSWVAHPDLVPIVKEVFEKAKVNHIAKKEQPEIFNSMLINTKIPGEMVTESGIRSNISVALQYMGFWLAGLGAVAINNLMEDCATAEISRTQLWQWLKHKVALNDGRFLDASLCESLLEEELIGLKILQIPNLDVATKLLRELIYAKDCPDFFTIIAYPYLLKNLEFSEMIPRTTINCVSMSMDTPALN